MSKNASPCSCAYQEANGIGDTPSYFWIGLKVCLLGRRGHRPQDGWTTPAILCQQVPNNKPETLQKPRLPTTSINEPSKRRLLSYRVYLIYHLPSQLPIKEKWWVIQCFYHRLRTSVWTSHQCPPCKIFLCLLSRLIILTDYFSSPSTISSCSYSSPSSKLL